MSPVSPIHFFHISIAGPTITNFEPSARLLEEIFKYRNAQMESYTFLNRHRKICSQLGKKLGEGVHKTISIEK